MTSLAAVISRFDQLLNTRPILPPPVPVGRTIRIGVSDHQETLTAPSDDISENTDVEKELGWAEGQTFMICYVDSSGNETERRITVRDLRLNTEGIPLLVAWCHERSATRTFRLDRVTAVINRDGEFIKPPYSFFVESFGMSPRLAACDLPKLASLVRIRKSFTHHLMPLAHLASIDGYLDADEQGIILDHCLRLSSDAGLRATSAEEQSLRRYLRTLKPTKFILNRALNGLERDSPKRITALVATAHHVMDADGFRSPEEEKYLLELKQELTGLSS